MRILFTTVPVFGHLLPMVPLAIAARDAGHDVLVASGVDIELECKRLGLPFAQVGPSVAESTAVHRPDVRPDATPAERVAADVAHLFVPAARLRAEDLLPLAMHWRPDLVVHEPSEMAGAIAAACTGARHAVHGLGLWSPGFWSLFEPGFADLAQRWRVRPESFLDAVYLDPFPQALQPGGPVDFTRVLALRPDAPPDDVTVLDLPGDAVYLTLGTIFNGAHDVFRTVLSGLTTLPHNVIVTAGPGADPALLGDWPSRVRITDFVPQERLLPHCRLVISHGGAGSVVGALRHGLPQLVVPRGADNTFNAAAVRGAGAGLSLDQDELTPEAVADTVTRLLTQPSFAAAARRVAAEIAEMPTPADVLTRLLH